MQQREWKRLALQRNPQLNDLRERIFPTQRAARFVQLHRPYTEKDDEMRKCFFLLALQAMQYYGFRESVTNLSRESGLNSKVSLVLFGGLLIPLKWRYQKRIAASSGTTWQKLSKKLRRFMIFY